MDVPGRPDLPSHATSTNSDSPRGVLALGRAESPNSKQRSKPNQRATRSIGVESQHRAGSGDIRVSLMWNNRNDIDLHVVDPSGEEIFFGHRQARSGGLLDIDMNASAPLRAPAVENVFWPGRAAPNGTYRVYVNHYSVNDRVNDTDFTVRVLVRGRTADFTGRIRFGERARLVHQFTLSAGDL